MKRAAAYLLILIFPALGLADPPSIKLPPEVKGDVGSFILIKADTPGKVVRWYSADSDISIFPPELLRDTKTTIIIAKRPGRYKIIAWTALADEPSMEGTCVVIVGGDVPPPPPPPKPPDPPTPPPKPPDPPTPPPDPLVDTLSRAYQVDNDFDKFNLKTKFVSLYRQGAMVALQPDVPTLGKLYLIMIDASKTLGVYGKLMKTQVALQVESKAAISTDPNQALDNSMRIKIAAHFNRLADALEKAK